MKTRRKESMNDESWKSNKRTSFTPLVFTTTGMGRERLRYHSRLAELISIKKGEDYAKTLTWIRGKSLSLFWDQRFSASEAPDQLGGGPIMLKTLMWTLNLPDLEFKWLFIIIIIIIIIILLLLLFFLLVILLYCIYKNRDICIVCKFYNSFLLEIF